MHRLTRRRNLRILRLKTFRFRQAQQFIALVGLSLCYFTRTFSVLRHRTIWARERSSGCCVNDWQENFRMCPETFNHLCNELGRR